VLKHSADVERGENRFQFGHGAQFSGLVLSQPAGGNQFPFCDEFVCRGGLEKILEFGKRGGGNETKHAMVEHMTTSRRITK